MKYTSTRGQAPVLSFSDVLLTGLASDGGLYVPEMWPRFSKADISAFAGRDYADVAVSVLTPLVGDDISSDDLSRMCRAAYASFTHDAVTPLVQLGPENWVMELFHGPTLAFKDVAMQLLGQLFEHILGQRDERLTIVGATSGDTGAAAIEALRGLDAVDIFILHPEGRVSEVQRRLMTSVPDDNVHNIAIKGSFDDCQALVKDMFANVRFRDDIRMGAINSINWARIMAQTVYYFTSSVALDGPERAISYCVPTGNFGDVFAGFVAQKMGLPVNMLCVATNRNDILDRAINSGRYEPAGVSQTISPSMDIQVSSNFERLLFEASGRNAQELRGMMASLKQSGRFSIPAETAEAVRQAFSSSAISEEETKVTINKVYKETGELVDPHTAVGLAACEKLQEAGKLSGPVVTLSTAHPAKFPDAVAAASGVRPALPAQMRDLFERPEYLTCLPNSISEVQAYIQMHARAA